MPGAPFLWAWRADGQIVAGFPKNYGEKAANKAGLPADYVVQSVDSPGISDHLKDGDSNFAFALTVYSPSAGQVFTATVWNDSFDGCPKSGGGWKFYRRNAQRRANLP